MEPVQVRSKEMNRIGIFVFYDKDGVVDDCVCYLLDSLKNILRDLIIVSNGSLSDEGIEKFHRYTKRIFFREDKGFDLGACKDVFCKFLENEKWEQWDEVVILNDTFYGPFFDWKIVFEYMEKKNIDFWALDEENKKIEKDKELTRWIIPYFYVVRKSIIKNNVFKSFWEKIDCEVVEYGKGYGTSLFQEYELTRFLKQRNFRYTTWLVENDGCKYLDIATKGDHNTMFSYELLKYCKFPIIRKKALSIFFYPVSVKALDYIDKHTDYDIGLILESQTRLYKNNAAFSYSEDTLKKFVETHEDIYVFGHGLLSNGLTEYFKDNNWKIKAYVVSKRVKDNEIALDNLNLKRNDGVIVALGIVNMNEMRSKLQEKIPEDQLLMYQHRSMKSEMRGSVE